MFILLTEILGLWEGFWGFSRGETFWKKFLPEPLFKNFQTKQTDKVGCRFGIPNWLCSVQRLRYFKFAHTNANTIGESFLEGVRGNLFRKKVSPRNYKKENHHGKKD